MVYDFNDPQCALKAENGDQLRNPTLVSNMRLTYQKVKKNWRHGERIRLDTIRQRDGQAADGQTDRNGQRYSYIAMCVLAHVDAR